MILLQNRILKAIAEGEELAQTVDKLCLGVQAEFRHVRCSILTVDRAGLLHPLSAPSLPEGFWRASDGMLPGPNSGPCGRAAYRREIVLSPDIEGEACVAYQEILAPAGIRACWSFPVCDAAGEPFAIVSFHSLEPRDPTEEEMAAVEVVIRLFRIAYQQNERAVAEQRRASTDSLTHLPNRAAFTQTLSQLSEDRSWAVLAIDLDNLKVVNDTLGHLVGDDLICLAARRISEAVSPDATFRLGGDEFAVVVRREQNVQDLQAVAQRILTALADPADCGGHRLAPRATIGGATPSPADRDPSDVHRNADFALNHAKDTNRGCFVRYWSGIGARVMRRLDVVAEVRRALADNQIDAVYQPVVRLDSREIVGVEALCNIRTTNGGILETSPLRDALADAEIAADVTRRMLAIVASDVRHWLDEDVPFQHVGVNIPPANFYSGDLLELARSSFDARGVPLKHLIIEVNEGVHHGQRDHLVAQKVMALREVGLRVALDDFGTAYASLTHLGTIPADILKIDRSMIEDLRPDHPRGVIAEGLIGIARKLGFAIVADGVESEEQAAALLRMGCRLGQGRLFSEPLDRTAMSAHLFAHAQYIVGVRPLDREPAAVRDVTHSRRALPTSVAA